MAYLMAYTKALEPISINRSLHLALSQDGVGFEALNAGLGICFAKRLDGEHTIEHPFIVKQEDGFLLLAASKSRPGVLSLHDSKDLIAFTNERLLDLSMDFDIEGIHVEEEDGQYRLYISSDDLVYRFDTKDFVTLSKAEVVDFNIPKLVYGQAPTDAVPSHIFQIKEDLAKTLEAKLMPVRNTALAPLTTTIQTELGQEPDLPVEVEASYSDGTTRDVPITWDLSALDLNIPGTYTVTGRIGHAVYDNPFLESKADPWIYLADDGMYYFTASYPMYTAMDQDGYSRVTLRRASTIEGLKEAEETAIWIHNEADGIYRNIWAPEIHQIDGRWYLFFTGSIEEDNLFAIRPQLLTCPADKDPMVPEHWSAIGRMEALADDDISFTQFSLDMTTFEAGGKHYVCWAEKTISDSVLYLATIDPNNPSKLTSKPMLLTRPEFAWEQIRHNVNEGAAAIKHDGKIFIAFSAAGTGPEYCIGIMTADETSDLLDPSAWTKTPYPILATSDVKGEYGPGHNSFTKDEAGRDIFVYHARSEECFNKECAWANEDPLHDPCRHARIKPVHWTFDGTPVLKMTPDQFVDPSKQDVSIEIVVQA